MIFLVVGVFAVLLNIDFHKLWQGPLHSHHQVPNPSHLFSHFPLANESFNRRSDLTLKSLWTVNVTRKGQSSMLPYSLSLSSGWLVLCERCAWNSCIHFIWLSTLTFFNCFFLSRGIDMVLAFLERFSLIHCLFVSHFLKCGNPFAMHFSCKCSGIGKFQICG